MAGFGDISPDQYSADSNQSTFPPQAMGSQGISNLSTTLPVSSGISPTWQESYTSGQHGSLLATAYALPSSFQFPSQQNQNTPQQYAQAPQQHQGASQQHQHTLQQHQSTSQQHFPAASITVSRSQNLINVPTSAEGFQMPTGYHQAPSTFQIPQNVSSSAHNNMRSAYNATRGAHNIARNARNITASAPQSAFPTENPTPLIQGHRPSKRLKTSELPERGHPRTSGRTYANSIGPFFIDPSGNAPTDYVKLLELYTKSKDSGGGALVQLEDFRRLFNSVSHQDLDSDAPRLFRGYQKAIRVKDAVKGKWKCTLGCGWSHRDKGNWKRHERTHYPPEIWLCNHPDCLNKNHQARASFRKDLAKRHFKSKHNQELKDSEIEIYRKVVPDSLFPRSCCFQNCDHSFATFDDRSSHIETHLQREDRIDKNRIAINSGPTDSREPRDVTSEIAGAHPGVGNEVEDDSSQDGDHEDELSEPEDEQSGSHYGQDHNPDAGASGGGSSMIGGSSNFPIGKTKSHFTANEGLHGCLDPTYGAGGWAETNNSCDLGSGYGGYNTHDIISERRPWKALSALRLQLLPRSMAYGISKTPIVLKKIQLQAALALESTGMKQTQIVQILRRELAAMIRSVTNMSQHSEASPRTDFPVTNPVSLVVPSAQHTGRSLRIYQTSASLSRFGGSTSPLRAQIFPQDPGRIARQDNAYFYIGPTLNHYANHIYWCIPSPSFREARLGQQLPARLVHVGSLSKPLLHLDSSDNLPSNVKYCSVSHCWDDGSGLQLTYQNFSALRKSIPSEGLPTILQNAIKWSRESGVEFLWIDTLCIIQDSIEDWESEGSKLNYIYASASSSVVVTTSTSSATSQNNQLELMAPPTQLQILENSNRSLSLQHATSILRSDDEDSGTPGSSSPYTSSENESLINKDGRRSQKRKPRKHGHQIRVQNPRRHFSDSS